jgi:hypothetical protein
MRCFKLYNNLLIILVFILFTCNISMLSFDFPEKKKAYYREKVKSMFYHAYNGYLDYAYPKDELRPLSCTGQDTWGSYSLTLVDSLDTLLIMGNQTEFARASELVLNNLDLDRNLNISVFETNIRVIVLRWSYIRSYACFSFFRNDST